MYGICTDKEGDIGSTCTYHFILVAKNFCNSLFICENLFCKNCCMGHLQKYFFAKDFGSFSQKYFTTKKTVYSTCMCRCPELMQIWRFIIYYSNVCTLSLSLSQCPVVLLVYTKLLMELVMMIMNLLVLLVSQN